LLGSGRPNIPQSWNRYTYTLNSPLKFIDPTGLYEYAEGTTDAQKRRFEAARERLIAARSYYQNARGYGENSQEYRKINDALNALGDPNTANGVTVGFGATKDGTPAATEPGLALSDDGTTITGATARLTIDLSKYSNNDDGAISMAIDIGHEGTHIDNLQDYVAALPSNAEAAQKAMNSGFRFMSKRTSEQNAYTTSAYVAQALSPNRSLSYNGSEIWNPSWREADRQTKRSAGIKGILEKPFSEGGKYQYRYDKQLLPFVIIKGNDGGELIQ